MSWRTNIYNKSNENSSSISTYKIRISITGRILETTAFSLLSSGTNYSLNGDYIELGSNLSSFLNNNNLRILLNGVELDKYTEINYINTSSFSLIYGVDKEDIITIYMDNINA